MARCTAPRYGHRTASGAESCPACGSRYNSYLSYTSPYSSTGKVRVVEVAVEVAAEV